MAFTQAGIDSEIEAKIPTNTTGAVHAVDVRTVLHDMNAATFQPFANPNTWTALQTFNAGLLVGGATGGSMGPGTINASGGIYVNGVAVASPGGVNTNIQYNNSGALGGDPNFTWTLGSGLISKKRVSIGSRASIGGVVWAPGDPVNESIYPAQYSTVSIVDYSAGDLSAGSYNFYETLTIYPGYKHIGTGNAGINILDVEPTINSDSTGPFGNVDCCSIYPYNYGSGNIYVIHALSVGAELYGTGTVANSFSLDVGSSYYQPVTNGIGAIIHKPDGTGCINSTGLVIEDHTGVGSTSSYNMVSKGVSSYNWLEGRLGIGHYASDPANYGIGSTRPGVIDLNISSTYSGDLSGHDRLSSYMIVGLTHTGTTALNSTIGLDVEPYTDPSSTGPLNWFVGMYVGPGNYGSGSIGTIVGLELWSQHGGSGVVTTLIGAQLIGANYGPGSVGTVYCVQGSASISGPVTGGVENFTSAGGNNYLGSTVPYWIECHLVPPTVSGGTVTNLTALMIEDYSGIGTSTSYNIWSKGSASKNKFDGSIQVGTPTSGSMGPGTINASGGIYVNGVAAGGGGGSYANPTASIGLTAINGTATAGMRSDAAPALSQAIVPTWTGLHTFNGGARLNTGYGSEAIFVGTGTLPGGGYGLVWTDYGNTAYYAAGVNNSSTFYFWGGLSPYTPGSMNYIWSASYSGAFNVNRLIMGGYSSGAYAPSITTDITSSNECGITTPSAGSNVLSLITKRTAWLEINGTGDIFTGVSGGTAGSGGGGRVDRGYDYQTPVTGATITLADHVYHSIIDPAGPLAALTILMPSTPFDGSFINFKISKAITTTLTISPNTGQVVVGAPAPGPSVAGIVFTAIYKSSSTTWHVGSASASSGSSTSTSGVFSYPSITALQGVTPSSGMTAILAIEGAQSGRSGPFVFDPSNRSRFVQCDPGQGIDIAPGSDTTGASGSWVRQYTGAERLSWWGIVSDGVVLDPFGHNMVSTRVTGATSGANYGSGNVVRLLVVSSAGMTTGDYCYVNNTVGTGGFTANGSWVVTIIDPSTIDLSYAGGSSGSAHGGSGPIYVGNWTSGGVVQDGATAGPHVQSGFTDNTQALTYWQIWAIHRSAGPTRVLGASGLSGTITRVRVFNSYHLLVGDTVNIVSAVGTGGFNINGTWIVSNIYVASTYPADTEQYIDIDTHVAFTGAWVSGGFVQGSRGGHDIHVMADAGGLCWRSGGSADIAKAPQFGGRANNYAFSGLYAGLATTNYYFVAGITNLTMECDTGICQIQNTLSVAHGGWNGVGAAIAFAFRNTSIGFGANYFINQTNPGDNFFKLVTPSDALNLYLGQRVMLASLDVQYYGAPPNTQYFEYHQIIGIDYSTGVITVQEVIEYQHRTDYPDFDMAGVEFQCGKARVWIPSEYWDGKLIYKNIQANGLVGYLNDNQINANAQYASISGWYVETNNWRGCGFSETGSHNIVHYNAICETIGEIDKWVDNITYINGQNRYSGFGIQSACPKRFLLEGGDYADLVGLGQVVVANGTRFGLFQASCGYGYSSGSVFNGCKIEKVDGGTINDGIGNTCFISQSTVIGAAAAPVTGVVRLNVVSTATFNQGNTVNVSGVGGVTAANGIWSVEIVDSTHLDLMGTVSSGTYTTGTGLVENTTQVKVTGTANNGGFVQLLVTSTARMATNDTVTVFGVLGTIEANGTHVITVDSPGHITLQSVAWASHLWVSGGIVQDTSLISVTNAVSSTGVVGGLIRLTIPSTSSIRLLTNDYVSVSGIGGTTEANSNWKITKFDTTHIDLVGSVFTNTYTSGGVIQFFSTSSYYGGMISLNKTGMAYNLVQTWSSWIPGQTFFVDGNAAPVGNPVGYGIGVVGYAGTGIVRQVTEDALNIYIITDFPYATLPSWALGVVGGPFPNSQFHNCHVGQVTFNNCYGSAQAKIMSHACALGRAYYEYTELFLSDSGSYSFGNIGGEIISIEVNVYKPGNVSSAVTSLQTITADCRSGLVLDEPTNTGLQLNINCGVAGRRVLTQSGITGFNRLGGTLDAVTVGGVTVTSIPPGRIAPGNFGVYAPTAYGSLYQTPSYSVKIITDSGLLRRGPLLALDSSGSTSFTIKGPVP